MIGGISMKEELIDKLLNYFINENKEYLNIDIPNDIEDKAIGIQDDINEVIKGVSEI